MEFVLSSLYTLIFILIIRRMGFFRLEGFSSKFLPAVFILKVLSGFFLTWLYTNHYQERDTADIFKYFDDSKVLYDALFTHPVDFFRMMTGIMNDNAYFDERYYSLMNHWLRPFGSNYYNDTHIIIRFNAIVRLFSFGYFGVHTVFMNFVAITGLVALYKTFNSFPGVAGKILLPGICLIPSVLFWGSGVLKEGLLLFALGFFLMSSIRMIHSSFRIIDLIVLLLTGYLLVRLKFYILIALAGPLLAYWWVNSGNGKKAPVKYAVTLLLLLGIGLNMKYLSHNLDILHLIAEKQKEFICLAEFMNSGSTIQLTPYNGTTTGFFAILPEGLMNGTLRPYLWESNSLLMLVSAVENVLLWLLLLFVIIFMRKKSKEINMNLLLLSATYVFILFTLIGITTPVIGAMVRYKIPALPFIMLMISLIIDKGKANKLLPKNYSL